MSKSEDLLKLLEELKRSDRRIKACMIAKKGLEGLIMFPPEFKDEVSVIWEPLSRDVDDMLALVAKYNGVGLTRGYTEILGYGVLLSAITGSDTSVVLFIKDAEPLNSAGELAPSVEESKRRILALL